MDEQTISKLIEFYTASSHSARELNLQIPTALYKYQSFDSQDYAINNFRKDFIWVSDPKDFNDPYDCLYSVDGLSIMNIIAKEELVKLDSIEGNSLTEMQIIKESENPYTAYQTIISHPEHMLFDKRNNANKAVTDIEEKMKKGIASPQVSCFSEINNSILMWSHYSKNHTGFCVEFRFDLDFVKKNYGLLLPALYTESFIPMRELGLNSKIIAFITKSKEWNYEKEWRILSFQRLFKVESALIKFQQPSSLFLGAKISEENEKLLLTISKRKRIPVYKMQMSKSEYKLTPHQIL